ncbi:hypothetical protein [Planctomonas psychrotolerans]|uniref:hypothetical protein n=1 Tax=Planctomonas psychrotolerans TaxID=2528712 RepID=UPI001238668C|nr:hypothetical protein [Planctomonas psychrotolerans]
MAPFAAVVFCGILALLAVFQLALIAGAPLGRFAWGGQDEVLPRGKRVGSVTSIALYVVFALVAVQRAGLAEVLPGGDAVARVAMWVLTAYFALGIVLNGMSRSTAERWTMTPVCVVLAALALVLAMS